MPNCQFSFRLLCCVIMALLLQSTPSNTQNTEKSTTYKPTEPPEKLFPITLPLPPAEYDCSDESTCKFCQKLEVESMKKNLTLCIDADISIMHDAIQLLFTMDDTEIMYSRVGATSQPTKCAPMPGSFPVDLCLKMDEVKKVGLLGREVCMSGYTNIRVKEEFAFKVPCLQLSKFGLIWL